MSTVKCAAISVAVKGQRILIKGYSEPQGDRSYVSDEELDMDLRQAREVYRLLGAQIKLAEKSTLGEPSEIVPLEKSGAA